MQNLRNTTNKISWIWFAAATFFLYGLTNFCLGTIGEKTGNDPGASVSAVFLLWAGMGLLGSITLTLRRGVFSGIKKLFREGTGWVGITAGFTLALGMFTLKSGFIADPGSKGPIVAISSGNAMLVAFLAWAFLKERLTWRQFIGMAVILSGITLISLGNHTSGSITGALFGIATMILFGTTNYFLKYAGNKGADSTIISILLWLASGSVGVSALLMTVLSGRGLKGLDSPFLITLSILTGFILGLGMLTLKVALKRGPAGPAIAISGSNSALVLILDLIVFTHFPHILKIAGMIIIITGISIIALTGKKGHNK